MNVNTNLYATLRFHGKSEELKAQDSGDIISIFRSEDKAIQSATWRSEFLGLQTEDILNPNSARAFGPETINDYRYDSDGNEIDHQDIAGYTVGDAYWTVLYTVSRQKVGYGFYEIIAVGKWVDFE